MYSILTALHTVPNTLTRVGKALRVYVLSTYHAQTVLCHWACGDIHARTALKSKKTKQNKALRPIRNMLTGGLHGKSWADRLSTI